MSSGIGDYTKYIVGDEGFLIDTSNPGSAALDLGITALALTGVGAIPAAMLKAGVKGKKAKKLIDQAKKKSKERLSNADAADIMTSIGEVAGEEIMGVEGLAMGGIAQLKDGGNPSLLSKIFGKSKIGKILRIGDKIKDSKKVPKKTPKKTPKVDKEKSSLLFNPRDDLRSVREASASMLANETMRSIIRNSLRAGAYGTAVGGIGYGAMKGADALFGEDEKENTSSSNSSVGAPIEKPKSFLEKLQSMDPALARALIAGGAKMLQPTEGPARSFLGLGEFGEGFSESLAQSEAGKPVEQKAYEAYIDSIPEGETVPTYAEYLNYFTMKQDDRNYLESRVLQILRDRFDKKVDLSDIVLVDIEVDPVTGKEKETQIGANEALLNAGVNYKQVLNRIAAEGKLKS